MSKITKAAENRQCTALHEDEIVNFIDKINRFSIPVTETGCYLWFGRTNCSGYGVLNTLKKYGKRKNVYVHRFIYELTVGEIPEGKFVLHKCDIPACINPSHLMVGSQKENMEQCKLRKRTTFGENHKNSKLTEKDVMAIYNDERSIKEIAENYKISKSNVGLIKNGKRWSYLNE